MNTRAKKNETVNYLIDKIKQHECFYLIDITSLNVENNMILRRQCYDSNILMKVVKNSLINLALEKAEILNNVNDDEKKNCLKNISAFLFINEKYGLPGRILVDFKKKYFNKIELKCAYINGEFFFGKDKLSYLASLKTKNEIISSIVFSCVSKLNRLILSLKKHKENASVEDNENK